MSDLRFVASWLSLAFGLALLTVAVVRNWTPTPDATLDAMCSGWCAAHAYPESLYLPEAGHADAFNADACYCAAPVLPGTAILGEARHDGGE